MCTLLGIVDRAGAAVQVAAERAASMSTAGRCLMLACAAAALVTGCKSGPPAARDPAPELREIARTGYSSERHYATQTSRESWQVDDVNWDVSLAVPTVPGGRRLPVVVYFPGLGETAGAGAVWRVAWAAAGYFVVSVQLHDIGEAVWSSPSARNGDFRAIAEERFSARSSAARARMLGRIIDELARRGATPGSEYALADLTRVAIAGFDLGAQTASILAGEQPGLGQDSSPRVSAQALITLSPVYRGPDNADSLRYAAVNTPVLAVTATDDGDPYSLVQSPELRQVPWRSMPARPKFLLVIEGGSHRLLAGNGLVDPESRSVTRDAAGSDAGPSGKQDRGRRSGGRPGSLTPFLALDESGRGTDAAGGATRRAVRSGGAGTRPRAYNLNQIAAIQGVTTAFLDMNLKRRGEAETWLRREAAAWLRGTARLSMD